MPTTNGHGPDLERTALYLRVSSEEQRNRETIEIQEEFLDQFRDLYGLEVAEMHKDDGVSGTIPLHERPAGRRLLEDARQGKFGTVLLYRLDRLGRFLLVIVDAHDRLETSGVSLRSATEPIDTSNPGGRLIFQMLASFAEYEKATIRERTQAGLHRALRNGRFLGRLPYGHKLSPDGTGLVPVEDEARVVREIIANIAAGATLYSERVDDSIARASHPPAIVSGARIGAGVRDGPPDDPGPRLSDGLLRRSQGPYRGQRRTGGDHRASDLTKRLAAKSAEKDRYVRTYAQGHISEEELADYLADINNQISNLRLLISSVEDQLGESRHEAQSAAEWLLRLRERVSEVEADTPEAFQKRRELVRLLVKRITVDRDENSQPRVEITYRFGPPSEDSVPSVRNTGPKANRKSAICS